MNIPIIVKIPKADNFARDFKSETQQKGIKIRDTMVAFIHNDLVERGVSSKNPITASMISCRQFCKFYFHCILLNNQEPEQKKPKSKI